jgi:signal transduction histidine kinase
MSDFLELLKQFLPIEIAVIAAIFVYLLLLFKSIAERFISIAEKQTQLSETQAQYLRERLDVVEQYLGISDKMIDLRDKHIQKLEELAAQREAEITLSRKSLSEAREQLQITEQRYQEAVAALDLQSQQVEELQEAQRRLQQASRNEAIERILHELQTRLQPVIAQAEILMIDAKSSDSEEVYDRSSELLNSTLALSAVLRNVWQDMMEYDFTMLNIAPLLYEAKRVYQAEAVSRGLDIRIDLASGQGGPPVLEVSPYHLELAFNNLIHNAVKYSLRGVPTRFRYVDVIGKPAGEYYSIAISNSGIGILPEEIESGAIFENGYQGKLTTGEYRTGLGRGLTVAKQIIDQHQGYIEVESKQLHDQDNPEGRPFLTRFIVYLPYKQSKEG